MSLYKKACDITREDLEELMDTARRLQVSPLDLFAYATASDAIDQAEDEGTTPAEALSEYLNAELEDSHLTETIFEVAQSFLPLLMQDSEPTFNPEVM